ncbi:major allergen Pru av 1-like [Malania oleifera]|uniref:major allergen Pru av 1-like n=1 Tax=Malania oleifera TaxID=397392 RepID=UPI0025AEA428|nr:major allergen Pru av 1-like [Malania oleifera]XP_057964283.1 major allergen Pru av 1-like [Malania oleifera]
MGVTSVTNEFASSVAAARLFKASILDAQNLVPKLVPNCSVEILHGDGGPGTTIKINNPDGTYVKPRFDALDKDNNSCKYTWIEGEPLKDNIEAISFEVKVEDCSQGGGSVVKTKIEFHTTGEAGPKEEEVKANTEKLVMIYKLIETYLAENPAAYA